MDCCGLSDIGRNRAENEDQFLIADLNRSLHVHQSSIAGGQGSRLFGPSFGKLFAVADGMGGRPSGRYASELAITALSDYFLESMWWAANLTVEADDSIRASLVEAIDSCHARLVAEIDSTPQRAGMGSTLTIAMVAWPRLYVAHVGDSRCYLLANGTLTQLTEDHSVLQENHSGHTLWNVVGGHRREPIPQVFCTDLEPGQSILLCTDGLTGVIDDDEIARVLHSSDDPTRACRALIDATLNGGGPDNVTVVNARFRERDLHSGGIQAEVNERKVADGVEECEEPPGEGSSDPCGPC